MDRPRKEILKHVLKRENRIIITTRQLSIEGFNHCFGSNKPTSKCSVSSKTKEGSYAFPLYQYHDGGHINKESLSNGRSSNINLDIFNRIGLQNNPKNEKLIFNYIFAILNLEEYRSEYKSF